MNTEYEIFKLFNGEYDKPRIAELFGKMSYDSALLNDFLSSLSLKLALNNSGLMASPRPDVKNSLMSKIDFNATDKSAVIVNRQSPWKTGTKYFLTTLISSLLTYLLMLNFHNGNNFSSKNEKSALNMINYGNHTLPLISENLITPHSTADNRTNEHQNKRASTTNAAGDNRNLQISSGYSKNYGNNGNSPINNIKNQTENEKILPTEINNRFNNSLGNPAKFDRVINPPIYLMQTKFIPNDKPSHYGLSIEIIMNEDWHLPSATITPEEFQSFNNSSLAILYSLTDNFSVGADIRRENFFERYEGKDPSDKLYKFYSQTENSINYGIFARYSYRLNDYFSPYIQSGMNISSTGPILRMGSGMAFYPVQYFGITLSAEYSRLFFQHLGIDFYTEKAGLRIGIIKEF